MNIEIKKEKLETQIREWQKYAKKYPLTAENDDPTKIKLHVAERSYRYHYEGGSPDIDAQISRDDVWIGCKTCPWERHRHKEEDISKAICDNCQSKKVSFYKTSERKKRTGKSFIDGKDLGGIGNKCKICYNNLEDWEVKKKKA